MKELEGLGGELGETGEMIGDSKMEWGLRRDWWVRMDWGVFREKRGSLEFVGQDRIRRRGSLKSSSTEGVIWIAESSEEGWNCGSPGLGDF